MPDTTSTSKSPQSDYITTARKRFESSRSAWDDRRKSYNQDARAVNVLGGQWDKAIKDARESSGRPALEFNELHIPISRATNQCRKDRPQPKISAGDNEATEEIAAFCEDRFRHIQYASQADVAYDQAVESALTGGFGFYEVVCEYADADRPNSKKPTWNQEPRIKRILDATTEYPDPAAIEPDFSDAKFWFSRFWMKRDDFEEKFGVDPVPFQSDGFDPEWVNDHEDMVCVAKYWYVEIKERSYVSLANGEEGYRDEINAARKQVDLPEITDDEVENERAVPERKIWCDTIDAEKCLKHEAHPGQWIPKIPVLGRQVVVEGKQYLISMVRFSHDGQRLKNTTLSGVAQLLQTQTLSPISGPAGSFVDKKYEDCHIKPYAYVEWTPVVEPTTGQLLPPPVRNTVEAPVQALTASALQFSDQVKRSTGYSDGLQNPSQEPISGVAVERRNEQMDLATYHFEDNLVRSQWHCARVVMDLDFRLADTPRILRGRKSDGSTYNAPLTMASEQGAVMEVPGFEGKPHMRFDIGRYDVVVESGQIGYATKRERDRDVLTGVIQADPAQLAVWGDRYFELLDLPDIAERQKLALLPAIQQHLATQNQEIDPAAMQQMLAQQGSQLQQMQQQLQQMALVIKTDQIKNEGRLAVENVHAQAQIKTEQLKLAGDLVKAHTEHGHAAATQLADHHHKAAGHMADLTHDMNLAKTPPPLIDRQGFEGRAQ